MEEIDNELFDRFQSLGMNVDVRIGRSWFLTVNVPVFRFKRDSGTEPQPVTGHGNIQHDGGSRRLGLVEVEGDPHKKTASSLSAWVTTYRFADENTDGFLKQLEIERNSGGVLNRRNWLQMSRLR